MCRHRRVDRVNTDDLRIVEAHKSAVSTVDRECEVAFEIDGRGCDTCGEAGDELWLERQTQSPRCSGHQLP